MGRKKKKFYKSKWEEETYLFEAKILRFEEHNLIQNEKWKNVFYCESSKCPEGRLCILWGRTVAEEGDTVAMKGRFKDEVFLVWSMNITKKGNNR